MMRLSSDPYDVRNTTSYANYYALPAGATAVTFAILCGLFLLELSERRVQWKLLPLMLAALGLTVYPISVGSGTYFLSQFWNRLLTWSGIPWVSALAIVIYLVLHRDRGFWRAMGIVVLASAAVFIACWAVSALSGGYLAGYMRELLLVQLPSGILSGLRYWITQWLLLICTLLGLWDFVRATVRTRTEARTLKLKNQLVMDNYRSIENNLRESARLRHEFAHRLSALDAMYQTGDMDALGRSLAEWKIQSKEANQVRYTPNVAVNAIVQDAAGRARSAGIEFDAIVSVPEKLGIPDEDICTLLMNLLDNAAEAASLVPPGSKKFIKLRMSVRDGFLAVWCANSYDGTLPTDDRGRIITRKSPADNHGFGLAQMTSVAERYGSILDISRTQTTFTVQTALKLPS